MVKYICRKCSFRYTPKTGKVPKKCPYCDNDDTLVQDETAQNILDTSNF